MEDGTIKASLFRGDARSNLLMPRSDKRTKLNDNKWHKFKLIASKGDKLIQMEIDDIMVAEYKNNRDENYFRPNLDEMYLG